MTIQVNLKIHNVAQALLPAVSTLMPTGLLRRGACALASVFLGILRELSDENAYHRHLALNGLTHSGPEWRRFSETRMREKYMRAKCC